MFLPASRGGSRKRPATAASHNYHLQTVVGRGGYGEVWLAEDRKSKRDVAIKKQSLHVPPRASADFSREVTILSRLKHRNIVGFKEYFEDRTHANLVTEFCDQQDLCERIMTCGPLAESSCRTICFDLLHAVNYMHQSGYTHRDIKPENICFHKTTPKLVDFGLSCGLEVQSRQCGSAFYIAPEVLNQRYGDGTCDVWSIGVVLFVMLAGYPPFQGESTGEIARAVLTEELQLDGSEWDEVSFEARDLLQQLLVKNPRDRITAAEALDHSWFEGLDRPEQKNVIKGAPCALHSMSSAAAVVHSALHWKRLALRGRACSKCSRLDVQTYERPCWFE